jgi:hypothetical protein
MSKASRKVIFNDRAPMRTRRLGGVMQATPEPAPRNTYYLESCLTFLPLHYIP